MVTMLVTDGQCRVRNVAIIEQNKKEKDKIVAVITNSMHSNIQGIADECYVTNRQGLHAELVKVGKGLL